MAKINYFDLITQLKKLYDEKEAKITFSSNGIQLRLPNKFKEWLKERNIEDDGEAEEIQYKINIFSRTLVDLLNERVNPDRPIKSDFVDEPYEELVNFIKETFIDEKLKKKFLFETTVKNLVLKELIWEIQTKKFDSDIENKIENLNTALLKFLLEDKTVLSFKDVPETYIIEVDEEVVDYLIDELKKIKQNLKNG
jgi:hypothetical protein